MAFQDSVAQSLTGNGSNSPDVQAQTGRPDDATMPPSAVPPTPAPIPTANQSAQQEPAPMAVIHPHHRSFFGAVASALVGGTLAAASKTAKAVAGPQPTQYTTDANGRVIPDPNQKPDTTSSRLQRIALAALEGLAAGSRVPSGPNRGAQAAAGIGAGAEAAIQRGQQQDLIKRQQARQDYEAQEKAKMDNAVRAMHLASTYSLWQKAVQEENDHDPERAKNMDVVNAARDYISRNPATAMSVDIVTPEQAKAIHDQEIAALKNDPAHKTKLSVMLPLGMTEAKDQDGEPLFERGGVTPKHVGQIAVIKGGDRIPLPQSFVDDAKEYGTLAGIAGADRLTPGQEVPIAQFLTMDAKLNAAKNREIDGWKNAKDVILADGKTHGQLNTVTNKTRPYPEGAIPVAVKKEEAEIAEKGAQGRRADAESAKFAEETKQLREWDINGPDGKGRIDAFGNAVGAPGMDKKEYLKRVDAYTKDYSKDLNQLDAARSQLSDIIGNAQKTKKLPGADAVVGIFDAIGISSAPLKGRGFRINNSVVSEHVEGTRNAWQSMALKLSRLTPEGTGQIVSLEQLKDYERIMDQARLDAYLGAANDAVNRGIGIQFAPRGNGAAIDPNTMRIFLTLAKGDPIKASVIAKRYGWTPPR